jgi:hypothetical protein
VCKNLKKSSGAKGLNPSAQRCLPRFCTETLIFKGHTARHLYKSFGVKRVTTSSAAYREFVHRGPDKNPEDFKHSQNTQKTDNVRENLTLKRVLETIVVVEKQ